MINTARGPVDRRGGAGRGRCARARSAAPGSTCSSASLRSSPGLLGLDNVVLAPHIGSATVETRNEDGVHGGRERDRRRERRRAAQSREAVAFERSSNSRRAHRNADRHVAADSVVACLLIEDGVGVVGIVDAAHELPAGCRRRKGTRVRSDLGGERIRLRRADGRDGVPVGEQVLDGGVDLPTRAAAVERRQPIDFDDRRCRARGRPRRRCRTSGRERGSVPNSGRAPTTVPMSGPGLPSVPRTAGRCRDDRSAVTSSHRWRRRRRARHRTGRRLARAPSSSSPRPSPRCRRCRSRRSCTSPSVRSRRSSFRTASTSRRGYSANRNSLARRRSRRCRAGRSKRRRSP